MTLLSNDMRHVTEADRAHVWHHLLQHKSLETSDPRVIVKGEISRIYKKWFESPIPPNQVNLRLPMNYLLWDFFRNPTDFVPG